MVIKMMKENDMPKKNTQGREEKKSGATDTRGRVAITRGQNTHLNIAGLKETTLR